MYARHPFSYSQSCQLDQITGNPVKYTESYTIAKIPVESLEELLIKDLRITINFNSKFNKTAIPISPKIALVLGTELELIQNYADRVLKRSDRESSVIDVNDPGLLIVNDSLTSEFASKFINLGTMFSGTDYDAQFERESVYSQLIQQYGLSFVISDKDPNVIGEYSLKNTNNESSLYIIPYCSLLLRTEFFISGDVSFNMEVP